MYLKDLISAESMLQNVYLQNGQQVENVFIQLPTKLDAELERRYVKLCDLQANRTPDPLWFRDDSNPDQGSPPTVDFGNDERRSQLVRT